jgi:nucleotidyltransferase substrate binding protein (TIGR01987 family)
MEKLKDTYAMARKAAATVAEILSQERSIIIRDASIQRFEYTFETIWKTAKVYLEEHEGIPANSPKSVFRELFAIGLIQDKDAEMALAMTDDRNLIAHTYIETIAETIYSRLPNYLSIMTTILDNIKKGAGL